MGIKDFLNIDIGEKKTIRDLGEIISYESLSEKMIGVDALNLIHKNLLLSGGELLSFNGKRTHHIYITINQIIKLINNKICTHWFFDSKIKSKLKKETIEKRIKAKGENKNLFVTSEEIDEIKKLLRFCGLTYSIVRVEAEFYAAKMSKEGVLEGVLSEDVDVIVCGGILLKPVKIDNKSKLLKIDGKRVCETLKINEKDLIKIATMMGWDGIEKTPRIGKKTVLKKFRDVVLSEKQEEVVKEFQTNISIDLVEERSEETKPNIEELEKWLTSLNFKELLIKKLVKTLTKI